MKLDWNVDDTTTEDWETILKRVHRLLELSPANPKQPVFTLSADILPALSFICSLCPHVDIQAQALNLLRSMSRREGIWDSQELADIFEDMMAAQKKGLMTLDDVPFELPTLAKMLSSLSISKNPASEEILLLDQS
jgi:hypothetical protein